MLVWLYLVALCGPVFAVQSHAQSTPRKGVLDSCSDSIQPHLPGKKRLSTDALVKDIRQLFHYVMAMLSTALHHIILANESPTLNRFRCK
jgi:hypothetical protein